MIDAIRACSVQYHTLGETDRSAMPLGNGELACSAWMDAAGLNLYLSRTDALTERDRTVKLGLLRVSVSPNPFGSAQFVQTLEIASGRMLVRDGTNELELFVAADEPVVYLAGRFDQPRCVTAEWSTWRTAPYSPHPQETAESADKLYTDGSAVLLYHINAGSILQETAALEGLGDCTELLPDALGGRIFGGRLSFEQPAEAVDGNRLKTAPLRRFTATVATHSMQGEEETFLRVLRSRSNRPFEEAAQATARYWNDYWEASYIQVSGDAPVAYPVEASVLAYAKEPMEYTCDCPSPVTRAYTLTKYMFACCNRGSFPVLYNGMLFNLMPGNDEHFDTQSFGRCYTAQPGAIRPELNPDERSWCTEHLWQNMRHPFHSLLARGEWERMPVLFSFMRRFQAVNRERARRYYHAEGQHSTEMTLSFGLQSMNIYGRDRQNLALGYTLSRYGGAVDVSPGLELVCLMLDYWDFTKDSGFLEQEALPYAQELLTYIATRFRNRREGRLVIGPLQSVETYRDTINPLPVVAGLHAVVRRILDIPSLPEKTTAFFQEYARMLPPLAEECRDGKQILSPAGAYDPTRYNAEAPELYAIFPFRLFGHSKPKKKLAEDTFAACMEQGGQLRPFSIGETPGAPSYGGWQYVGVTSALLGQAEVAAEILQYNCAAQNPGTRFPAMWGPIYDAVPDTDHGANILTLLQNMVMQTEKDTIYLLPAFPASWDVSFRLYADIHTTVEAEYKGGRLCRLQVTPPEREKDVVLCGPLSQP